MLMFAIIVLGLILAPLYHYMAYFDISTTEISEWKRKKFLKKYLIRGIVVELMPLRPLGSSASSRIKFLRCRRIT